MGVGEGPSLFDCLEKRNRRVTRPAEPRVMGGHVVVHVHAIGLCILEHSHPFLQPHVCKGVSERCGGPELAHLVPCLWGRCFCPSRMGANYEATVGGAANYLKERLDRARTRRTGVGAFRRADGLARFLGGILATVRANVGQIVGKVDHGRNRTSLHLWFMGDNSMITSRPARGYRTLVIRP